MTTSILLTNSFPYISQTPKTPKPFIQTPQLKPINIFPRQAFSKSTHFMHTNCLIKSHKVHKVCVVGDSDTGVAEDVLVGEDSAKFELAKQKISSWVYFGGVLGVVLFILDVVWLDNTTGFGKVFIDSVESVSDSPEVVMFLLTLIFAIVHSGLASLRDPGEKLIGERAFRVLFAGTSLPLAVSTIGIAVGTNFLDNFTPSRFSYVSWIGDSDTGVAEDVLVGEDSAKFELAKQKISSWVYFGGVLGVVLFILDVVWLDNTTGFGKVFIESVESVSDSPEVVMFLLTLIFAIVHSGLASLRDPGEKLIGERAFRVLFAGTSLPLAVSTIVYFINHRYDGVQLWQLQSEPLLHHLLWITNFISFFFLYPSTFNLLEVAAVDKPKMHLWESGIMRITRHPQLVGQVMWCLAHTIWIGNSVAVAASVGLIGHHLFGAWNGDRRLRIRYGEAFDIVKSRTSVLPFAAILDGRQKLPKDYYKEFIRLPYLVITGLTLGAYLAHPLMQAASLRLHW
ncbi:15-cis-zeta-carotene isomerase, chloroplastic [Artemisia annua]|uniref:15-cis-zeta-carotene isomerase, chloroplastic n=1 Tax=Artemisia annua TaxID=35608 RepID=A0A2U1LRK7_ARTAN|nr:15-cis-zeta-carotene isomerase, chloroplastic [Artemisia annua]